MSDRYGATPEAWALFSERLGLTADLLPVVSNPNAEISPASAMQALGKTPSRYNHERKVVGIGDWTSVNAQPREIKAWAAEPDYGICVQTRWLRAIDVDVADYQKSTIILSRIADVLNHTLPVRRRKNSGKLLVPFWLDGELPKHVIPVEGGLIEILGDGQQFIAAGAHIDSRAGYTGYRYEWVGEVDEAPTLDEADFAMLLAELKTLATGEIKIARQRRAPGTVKPNVSDDVAAWLVGNWEVYDEGRDGQLFIQCPFEVEHSSDTGPSSTAYFPAGTGGYSEGNFVCLHAHCTGREQAEFLRATGFVASEFPDLSDDGSDDVAAPGVADADARRAGTVPDRDQSDERGERRDLIEAERWPRLTRTPAGLIEATMNNLMLALAAPQVIGRRLAYDGFKDELVWAPAGTPFGQAAWRLFRDSDYARLRQQLELRGFKPMGMELLRLAVLTVAEENAIDTAQEWLKRLRWDGVPRVAAFAHRGWSWADTPYSEAVSRYVWTALAGRVLEPGVQADMAPILYGPQGYGKTSAIKAMSPHPDFYAEVKLDETDDNTSRRLRGKLIGELEELRGLNSRASEEIKAFISRTRESWVPKYREFATTFERRLLLFGTTNEDEILADGTGERRWLPGECLERLDIEWIKANRDQLWAEGASLFLVEGIDWRQAETLGRAEHGRFKVSDPWSGPVVQWLLDDTGMTPAPATQPFLSASDVMSGALGIPISQQDRSKEARVGKVLRALGWAKRRKMEDGVREYRYYRLDDALI